MSVEETEMAVGKIRFLEDGEEREWSVGCMSWETSEALKKHLATWRPKAHFISGDVIPDSRAAVTKHIQIGPPMSPPVTETERIDRAAVEIRQLIKDAGYYIDPDELNDILRSE